MAAAEPIAIPQAEAWPLRVVRGLVLVWVFALVLALYPYTQNPAAPIKDLITGWAVLAMALVYGFGMLRHPIGLRIGGPTLCLLGVFLAVNLIAALNSEYPLNSLNALRPWIAGGVLAVLVGNSFRRVEQHWSLTYAIVMAVALSSIYGYMQRFGLDPFPWAARNIEEYRGMPSTYANPNFAGHMLIPALFLALGVGVFKKRLLGFACFLLIASHLYLTDMRSARVAIVASLFIVGLYLLLLRRNQARPGRAAAWTLALVLLFVGAGLLGGLFYANTKAAGPLPIDSALILRLNGYYGAARMVMERPLLGFGPGSFEIETPRYWTDFEQHWYAAEGRKNDHVHNEPLEMAVDAGLPGAAFYVALILWMIFNALLLIAHRSDQDRRRLGYLLAGAVIAFAVDALFGFNLRVPVSASFFFVVVGMLHGLLEHPKPRGLGGIAMQGMLVLVALGVALAGTATFIAASYFHEARGAQAYVVEAREEEDASGVEQGHAAALAALAMGESWQPFDATFAEFAGQIYLAQGRGDLAVDAYTRAITLNPYLPALHAGLAQGWISQAMGRDELKLLGDIPDPVVLDLLAPAEAAAQAALNLAPRYAPAQEVLGQAAILHAQHDPGNARAHWSAAAYRLRAALQFGARNPVQVNQALAYACEALGELDAANAAYQRLILAVPRQSEYWDEYQAFSLRAGRERAFVDAMNEAIWNARAAQPETYGLRNDLTVRLAYFHRDVLKENELARVLANSVVADSPGSIGAWGICGLPAAEVLRARTSESEVLPDWLIALAANPSGDALDALIAKIADVARVNAMAKMPTYKLRRDFAWVESRLRLRLALEPDIAAHRDALGALVEIAALAQQWEECLDIATQALLLLTPNDSLPVAVWRVKALAALDRPAEALAAAREAVRLQPGAPAAKWALAQQLLANGKLAEARFEYQDLLRLAGPGSSGQIQMQLEAERVEARLAYAQEAPAP